MKLRRVFFGALGAWFVVCLVIGLSVALFGEPGARDYPVYTGLVVDEAGVIPEADEARLAARLGVFRRDFGPQFAVATVKTLDGASIESYANGLFRQWGLGDPKRNDGVLLLVAPKDRKVRIEAGYGVEGDLTDAIARLIIESAILPRFRTGDFAGGVERGVEDVILALGGDTRDFARRAAAHERRERALAYGAAAFIATIAFLIGAVWWAALGAPRGGRSAGRRGSSSSGRSSSSSSSSSRSSSSSGGGSSGGGGASGSW